MRLHLVAKHGGEIAQQGFLIRRTEEFEGPAVDIEHADFTHAARDELLVHIGEDPEVVNPTAADFIDQAVHPAEVLHPKRNRRMGTQAECIVLAVNEAAAGTFPLGHVLDRDQDAVPWPGRIVPWSWISRRSPGRA